MRGNSCLSNLILLYNRVIHLSDLGELVDCIFFYFSKAFDTISHRILQDKAACTQLNNHVIQWMNNWLTCRAQRLVVKRVTSNWHQVTGRVPQAHLRPRSPYKLLGCGTQGILSLPMTPNGRSLRAGRSHSKAVANQRDGQQSPAIVSWFERQVPAKEGGNLPWNGKYDPLPSKLL